MGSLSETAAQIEKPGGGKRRKEITLRAFVVSAFKFVGAATEGRATIAPTRT